MYKRTNNCVHRLKVEGSRDSASQLIRAWRTHEDSRVTSDRPCLATCHGICAVI